VQQLSTALKEDFPNVLPLPIGILFSKNEFEQVFVTQAHITLAVKDSPDYAKLERIAQKIFDCLLLDVQAVVSYDLIGLMPASGSASESSFSFINPEKDSAIKSISSINAVGLRFFYEFDSLKGEFKVEPFVRDPSQYFLQLILGTQTTIALHEVFERFDVVYHDFVGRLAGLASAITH
jgi:hypothetical protein